MRSNTDPKAPIDRDPPGRYSLDDLKVSPTASLFQGFRDGDVDLSYRRGEERIEAGPGTVIVIPPETPHGFENTGDLPLVQLGIHERGTMQQTWLEN